MRGGAIPAMLPCGARLSPVAASLEAWHLLCRCSDWHRWARQPTCTSPSVDAVHCLRAPAPPPANNVCRALMLMLP